MLARQPGCDARPEEDAANETSQCTPLRGRMKTKKGLERPALVVSVVAAIGVGLWAAIHRCSTLFFGIGAFPAFLAVWTLFLLIKH
jgi:hypothetical protein